MIDSFLASCQRVSRNEYHCPCPFHNRGKDRFIVWTDRGNWLCPRWQCPDCPGVPDARTGGMKGWLDQLDKSFVVSGPVTSAAEYHPPTMSLVMKYHHQLNTDTLIYLRGRGIGLASAKRFRLGTTGQRLTIPCLMTEGNGLKCLGIKKRWLEPLTVGRFKYIVEPGSMGLALFNADQLRNHQWKVMFVVEGPLDNILLARLGIPCVSPFGGGDVWDGQWSIWVAEHVDILIHIMDRGTDSQGKHPGVHHAHHRADRIGSCVKHGFTFPPGGEHIDDITTAWQARRDQKGRLAADTDLTNWLKQVAFKETHG